MTHDLCVHNALRIIPNIGMSVFSSRATDPRDNTRTTVKSFNRVKYVCGKWAETSHLFTAKREMKMRAWALCVSVCLTEGEWKKQELGMDFLSRMNAYA